MNRCGEALQEVWAELAKVREELKEVQEETLRQRLRG